MTKKSTKVDEIRSICFRRSLIMFASEYGEDETIYAYIEKDRKQIKYIETELQNKFLNTENLNCYKTTMKKLYLHLVSLSYPNLPRINWVVIANRLLRRKTVEDCAKLLGLSVEAYQRIENGVSGNFNLKEVAHMLNFNEEEFYYDFQKTFEIIKTKERRI